MRGRSDWRSMDDHCGYRWAEANLKAVGQPHTESVLSEVIGEDLAVAKKSRTIRLKPAVLPFHRRATRSRPAP